MKHHQISQHLPPTVRNALVSAAQINPGQENSRERIRAIDEAALDARRMYPHLFIPKENLPR